MLGVCYYPEHWPEEWWAKDAQRMRDMGIKFVRIGEFAWSRMEPKRGAFAWDWLDRAIDVLAKAGLNIVLGTPTATPPKWLMDEFPEIAPVDIEGRPRGHGSRRHYTFSSDIYVQESRRIVEIMAKRYGRHPAVVGWQTDNEFGCHNTVLSWGPQDLKAFRSWLRQNYQTTDQLNEAWGNVFWSMDLQDFDEVSLPNLTVTEANPAARLDFWRFQSSQVAAYNMMQCEIIREHSPGRWITHNFMGFFNEFDHWRVGEDLDLSSWDSYPIGFVERFPFSEDERARWAETSHPDIAPFHHDLYRGVGRGRFWVMEQQPGPVNWAPWNPVPKPGMIRLWTWEALAHGAEVVSYFRWRQATSAQEQMHAGLNLPGLHELSAGGLEAAQAGRELAEIGQLPNTLTASVAIVYDYESSWMTDIQPQGADFSYHSIAFRFYAALRSLGQDVDFVPPGVSLDGYKLVIVPPLLHVSDSALQAFSSSKAVILYGPRSGSKTRHMAISGGLPPGPLRELTGARVTQVSSLRPNISFAVKGIVNGSAEKWREYIETSANVLAKFPNGDAALTANGRHHYLACVPDEKLLVSVMAHVCQAAHLKIKVLPGHIRLRSRGELVFAFNYGEVSWKAPKEAKLVFGTRSIPPQSFAVWSK
ncbi:MAG: beta-galactosidase [Aestuariivirga sp.]